MSSYFERMKLIKLGLLPREAVKKEKKPLKKVSDKKAAEMKMAKGDDALDLWFEARRKEMTGKCLFCGGKTQWKDDQTYRHSIAHLLAKKDNIGGLPSVATHEDNWLELCYYGNSCHSNFDNKLITWEFLHDSYEWKIIVEKFKKIYPFIAEDEKKYIPDFLLKTLTNEIS